MQRKRITEEILQRNKDHEFACAGLPERSCDVSSLSSPPTLRTENKHTHVRQSRCLHLSMKSLEFSVQMPFLRRNEQCGRGRKKTVEIAWPISTVEEDPNNDEGRTIPPYNSLSVAFHSAFGCCPFNAPNKFLCG
mmetsp:Transcript_18830/g.27285  ORF Transcript_18830/g.27285 Transcript_18830/m.27285 type:complete len:135 (-) Transcript_18830:2526-2930(-)